jgi:hypothetical protein
MPPHPIRNKNTKRMLMSTFNGLPAPGGTFDERTKTYCKKLSPKAFFWPMRAFPVDGPVVDQLKNLHCETMTLLVIREDGEADRYTVDFETFTHGAKAIDWPRTGDRRFPARWYLPLGQWKKAESVSSETVTATDAHKTSRPGEPRNADNDLVA